MGSVVAEEELVDLAEFGAVVQGQVAAIVRIGAVLKRIRDLDVEFVGRVVWRASDEREPLVRSFLEITASVHAGR